ncbi:MAG TPA: YIP1 family protein [Symbiobacteriaceae bacterium]|jgi:hypothetical protein|nr:YIP1 family protein [Symbiobacteriaceae bacterium]
MSYYGPDPMSPEQRPSGWKAIVRVIYEPTAMFQEFNGRVPIFPGYFAQMLLGLISFIMLVPMTLRVLEQTMLSNPMYTPELAAISKWSGLVGGGFAILVTPWLAGLLTALIAMFFGQFQEERVGFTSYLGMLGYARMPLIISSLLGAALTLAMGDTATQFNLSLAALAPQGAPAMVTALLGTLNPFTAWYYFVLATGFGALHRGKAAKGVALVVTLYALNLLFSLAGAAIGGSFLSQMPGQM